MTVPLNVRDPAVTNLGYDLIERDFYPTPKWMAESLINSNAIPVDYTIWEPAAGNGVLVDVARNAGYHVVASDIHQNPPVNDFRADFLTQSTLPDDALCIWTNPPFGLRCKLAEDFIMQALFLTKPVDGMVIMLGRPDFDFAVSRRELFGECEAFAGRLNMSKRPRWIAGTTGAPRFNYSWFIWNWSKPPRERPFTIYDYDSGRDEK